MRKLGLGIAAILLLGSGSLLAGQAQASPLGAPHKTVKTIEKDNKYLFQKKALTVKVGTKVTWQNTSDAPHTVTHTSGNWQINKQLPENAKRSFTFTKTGTFKYYCAIHPYMKGKITVTM